MSGPWRLAGFAAILAVVFGTAVAVGSVIDPDAAKSSGAGEHGDEHGAGSTRDAAAADGGHAGAAVDPAPVSDGELRLVASGAQPQAGRSTRFAFRIVDQGGGSLRDYDVLHEAEMHLIVVRRDLTGYQHLHPSRDPDGTWHVDLTLPAAGVYRAFADFSSHGEAHTLGVDVTVPGDLQPVAFAARQELSVDGYDVRLEAGAGDGETLRFHVERNGRPVEDLEPYLGARGHLVVLREGDLAFLHVHPEPAAEAGTIAFAATFPSSGRYGLFLQFKHQGVVHTAPLFVDIGR